MPFIAPGQSPEDAKWYVPIVGMGLGPLANQWGATAAHLAKNLQPGQASRYAPTASNLAEWTGGANLPGEGAGFARAAGHTLGDLTKMPIEEAGRVLNKAMQAGHEGFMGQRVVAPGELALQGGNVPPDAVWSRAINAAGGMNSPQVRRILGLGAAGGVAMAEPSQAASKPVYREEDSSTIQAGKSWRNIEGPRSARAGQPLPKYYPFEKTVYPTEQDAVGAAIQRMLLQDYATGRKRYPTQGMGK